MLCTECSDTVRGDTGSPQEEENIPRQPLPLFDGSGPLPYRAVHCTTGRGGGRPEGILQGLGVFS